ncbi:MAG: glutathione binding-like protein [Halieaceae bacterium]
MGSITFWGLSASPYQLKMQSLADFAQLPWQRLPDQGSLLQSLALLRRLRKAQRKTTVLRFPSHDADMDEYPAVPYYTLDGKTLYYDSSGLAQHLDTLGHGSQSLLPEKGAQRFLCKFIDEAFDEFGLYMVHHNRWVTSAHTNKMGKTTADEMAHWLPAAVKRNIARKLSERQCRRLPYLFSVAPPGLNCGVDNAITPPERAGFPATHVLLDQAWRKYLAAIEHILSRQPYLLGQRFTLADASAYGQLGMNLPDGMAAELIQELAPRTYQWLNMINSGEHRGCHGDLEITDTLTPLLEIITDTFIPLMQQNEAAYEAALQRGQNLFNEAAFEHGEALYDGELLGLPFRSVVKSFQVVTWRELCEEWCALSPDARLEITKQFPFIRSSLFSSVTT